MNSIRIAVIGLGPAGLTALKTLREEGFEAVAFERRDQVGGLWSFSSNTSYTSVIQGTVSNISKFVSGFSDFPIPKYYPAYLNASQVAGYLGAYAKHFELEQHCRFKTTVKKVVRDDLDRGWNVHIAGPDGCAILYFDKVVFGSGSQTIPAWPPMPGKDGFTGTVIHGQHFRSPEQFFGKRVLVVGIGNTACEVSLSLAKHCSTLYQGYRRGRILVSRYLDNGIPTDSTLSWPVLRLKYLLDYWVPWLTVPIIDNFMIRKMVNDAARHESAEFSQKERTQRAEHKVKHIWRLVPCPSMAHENPAAQEKFIPALYSGDIIPVPGFKEFVGSDAVLLDDGSTVNVDAVIFCTGYSIDFSIMPELEMNGACGLPKDTFDLVDEHMEESKENGEDWSHRRNEPHLPRLYQMIFPPRYASSVAFLSWMAPQENVWCVCELASTAVAQIWAAETAQDLGLQSTLPAKYRNPALLPSVEEMNQAVDGYHDWWRKNWKQNSSMHPGFVRSYTFYRFLHDKAGTGMYENLDHFFSTRGWQLRWEDKELYEWLSNGPMNSYAWRLFDTNPQQIPGCGRKIWPGARQAVQDAYEVYQKYKKDMEDDEVRRCTLLG